MTAGARMSVVRVRGTQREISNDDELLISPGVSEPRAGRYFAVFTHALIDP
jgi:hypothetical protein